MKTDRSRPLFALAICLACAFATAAQPATRPTTTPVAETPADGVKAYDAAARAGDLAEMHDRMVAGTDDEKIFAEASIKVDAALGRLYKAAIAKFGPECEMKIAELFNDTRPSELGDSKIEGDRAVLMKKDGDAVAAMRRVDGKWKIDLTGTLTGQHDALAGMVKDRETAEFAAKSVADSLGKDEYKTLDDLLASAKKNLGN